MKLSIIILSYNTKDLISDCLRTILDMYSKEIANQQIELIVVDNASTDGSIEVIKKLGRFGLTLVENKKNDGFAKGCNMGEKIARGTYLLFLNSDTQVMDRSLLEMMKFLQESKSTGVVGGRLVNKDGIDEQSVSPFLTLPHVFLLLFIGERFRFFHSHPKKISRVDWVSGGCMMVKKEVFRKLKGFDENLFMYVEDMEFCYRVKEAGYHVFFYPSAHILHIGQGSSNRTFAITQIYKGLRYFYKLHKSPLQYSILTVLLLIKAKVAIFFGHIMHNSYLKNTYQHVLANGI